MATVKVACKLPNGLTVDHVTKDGRAGSFTLNGANHPRAVAGFGITEVDADLFKSWSEEHKDFRPLKNRLIFAHKDAEGAAEELKTDRTVKSGAEPLDPSKPAPGVEPTDAQKKELAKLPADPADGGK